MDTEFSLDNFPSEFIYDIDNKNSNGKNRVLIRANLQSKEDCERWLKAYESKTRTKWIVAKVITTPFRYKGGSVFNISFYSLIKQFHVLKELKFSDRTPVVVVNLFFHGSYVCIVLCLVKRTHNFYTRVIPHKLSIL
jgi:hypothetical protein